MAAWKPFLALPNYLGGKRNLASIIFREIARHCPPRTWPALTLLDPFTGACSISLYAKAQGLRVISGDIAERSYIVQQAIIANSCQKLDGEDLGLLFRQRNGYERFVTEYFVPAHFPSAFAEFLDLALANIADHPSSTKRAMLKLLLYKAMLGPVIHHGITIISRAMEADMLEDLPPHNAKRVEPWWLTPPPIVVERLARLVNIAIFSNGHDNLTYLSDAQDLVEEWGSQTDILYIDPPYPAVTGYEAYQVIDSVFAGRMIQPRRSPWSTSRFTLHLLNLLDAADGIPLWIISYGSVGVTLQQLLDLIESYRPAETVIIPYAHLQAIARPETAEANREYLIVAARS